MVKILKREIKYAKKYRRRVGKLMPIIKAEFSWLLINSNKTGRQIAEIILVVWLGARIKTAG